MKEVVHTSVWCRTFSALFALSPFYAFICTISIGRLARGPHYPTYAAYRNAARGPGKTACGPRAELAELEAGTSLARGPNKFAGPWFKLNIFFF